ncbi:MAG: ATPase, T2SS/T4P/T4SS family [Maledivibacter sp.]|nr:ATPase, T2SS/T4P/T4SS family [Maledivibacter sp.]
MPDKKLLKDVRDVLEKDLPPEVSQVINKLANEYIKNEKKENTGYLDDHIPDIEGLIYKAAVTEGDGKISSNSLEGIRSKLQEHLRNNHAEKFLNIDSDRAAREAIKKEIKGYCLNNAVAIKGKSREETIKILNKEILDYGILTDLIFDYDRLEDQKIEEIRVDDWNDIRIIIKGQEYRTKYSFESPEQCFAIAQRMCRNTNSNMPKKDCPFVRLRIGNSIRVSIMTSNVARRSDNPSGVPVTHMVIRKQDDDPFTRNDLIGFGSITDYGYDLILAGLRGGVSMAFYGGTNSGKTGTMRAFTTQIDKNRRTLSIAEIDEMDLREIDQVTGKAVNSVLMWEIDQSNGMDFQKLFNASLTFTPQTLVLQESKGGEIVAVINMSITGHQMVITIHAKDLETFSLRLLGMYKESGSDLSDDLILEYIRKAFPLLVRMKIYADGKRRVADVGEIVGYDRNTGEFDINVLYEFEVKDNLEEDVYDRIIGDNITKITTIGSHKVRRFYSDQLLRELKENGLPKRVIDDLYKKYKSLKDNQDKENRGADK